MQKQFTKLLHKSGVYKNGGAMYEAFEEPAPDLVLHETSKQQATQRVERLIARELRLLKQSGDDPVARNCNDYKEYLLNSEQARTLHLHMTEQMNIEANVAALALLATGANDLTQALDYIFEPD